uniref:Uncharacterized protein n=1 Tax=Leptocylindrus danicus TaxID=163516 RepID=A0A7S2KC37_9STRA|mmetsp:Transcript_20488/g.30538  ORF Transcript_20488/g.30538 Transcript_20488/m.30538 type:complete len:137 (+) Transcript_20488:161-571(+)
MQQRNNSVNRFAVTVASMTAVLSHIVDALSAQPGTGDRRSFLAKTVGVASSIAFVSTHGPGCACAVCNGEGAALNDAVHDGDCGCPSCVGEQINAAQSDNSNLLMDGHDSGCSCAACTYGTMPSTAATPFFERMER